MWKFDNSEFITTLDELEKYIHFNVDEKRQLEKIIEKHPMKISNSYLELINFNDPKDPLRKMVIPAIEEKLLGGSYDTSGEKDNTKFLGFQHKYAQTALVLSTNQCASYCRFCFRKRFVGISSKEINNNFQLVIDYILEHSEINNVLITGGDSLMLCTETIQEFTQKLANIEHLDFIRFGTRVPIYLPSRILNDKVLIELFKKINRKKQITMVIHINHPNEISKDFEKVVRMLIRSGTVLYSQTVLMKGINDSPEILSTLLKKIVSIGIKPYYVFQCRPVKSVKNHFQLSIMEALTIVEKAKTMLSGHGKSFKFIMSHRTGKIEILGTFNDDIYFKYHQAKDPNKIGEIFKKPINNQAGWLDEF